MELCRNRRDCFLSIRANSSSTTSSVWMAHSRWRSIVVKEYAILVCPCPYVWNQWGGGRYIPSHLGHNRVREKVCYCQSLPSNFVLLGASYSVYWWVQSLQDIQDGVKFIWSHKCSILICHPFDCCNGGYVLLGLSNSIARPIVNLLWSWLMCSLQVNKLCWHTIPSIRSL